MIKLIVCADMQGGIGYKNKLLYNISQDLKRFKELTTNKIVVMGSKTYESLPVDILPNRINIVLTRNREYKVKNDKVFLMHSIQEILDFNEEDPSREIFIIGGEYLYEQMLPFTNIIHLTYVKEYKTQSDAKFYDAKYLVNNKDDRFVQVESNSWYSGGLHYSFIDFVSKDYLLKQWKQFSNYQFHNGEK